MNNYEDYWKNLIYDIYYNIPCKLHKIANIFIFYNTKNLEIVYNFNKKDSNKIRTLLWTDYINSNFIEKIILNDKEIFINLELNELSWEFYEKLEKKIMNLPNENLEKNNKIIYYFSQTKNGLDEYLWFMRLVRYEVFEYEEYEFFRKKALETRQFCILNDETMFLEFYEIKNKINRNNINNTYK